MSEDDELRLSSIKALGDDRYELSFDSVPELRCVATVSLGEINSVSYDPDPFRGPPGWFVWSGDAASVRAVAGAVIGFHQSRRAGFVRP